MQNLEDIIKDSDSGDLKEQLGGLVKNIQKQEDSKLNAFLETLKGIIESQKAVAEAMDSMKSLLEKIANRPDPEFPQFPEPKEPPEVQKVQMDSPDWYVPPSEPSNEWIPNLTNSIRYDGDQTRKVLQQILEKLSEEKDEEELEEKPIEPVKTVNTAAVRSRRTTQWKRFDNYDLKNITAGGDGVTFYLPDSLIPNSETVRLNGGIPLLNTDYTLTGNRLFFTNGDQSQSTIEVRGQIK